jgi:hypothetical protein
MLVLGLPQSGNDTVIIFSVAIDLAWLAICVSIIAVVVAVLGIVYDMRTSRRVDRILRDMRRSEVAEKTAMMWDYAERIQAAPKVSEYLLARIRSDINAVSAIRELIRDEALVGLRNAGEAMFKEMENKAPVNQIVLLRKEFEALFL